MEWSDLKEQYESLKGQTYVIKNSNTGQFICNSQGEVKVFYDIAEAKTYIRAKCLSSIYCICLNEE